MQSSSSSDALLARWVQQRREIASQPLEESHFRIDKYCQCQNGICALERHVARRQCTDCLALHHLQPSRPNQANVSCITLETGSHRGLQLIVQSLSDDSSLIRPVYSRADYESLLPRLTLRNTPLDSCDSIWVSDNSVYHRATMLSLLSVSRAKPLELWVYNCGPLTTSIWQQPNLGVGSLALVASHSSFSDQGYVTPQAFRYILRELRDIFSRLREFKFTFGTPSGESLSFSDQQGQLCLHLSPSLNSAARIKTPSGYRLLAMRNAVEKFAYYRPYPCSYEWSSSFSTTSAEYQPLYESTDVIQLSRVFRARRVLTYRLHHQRAIFDIWQQGSVWTPTHDSFDLYAFLVILASDAKSYRILAEDARTQTVWRGFWHPNEYESLMTQLLSFTRHTHPLRYEEIYDLLSNYTLRVDALEWLSESLHKLS